MTGEVPHHHHHKAVKMTMPKKLAVIASLFTVASTISVAGWSGVVWALDATYVRQDALTHELDTRDFHRKEDKLTDRLLQYRIKGTTGGLSATDKALESVYTQELDTLRQNREDYLKQLQISK